MLRAVSILGSSQDNNRNMRRRRFSQLDVHDRFSRVRAARSVSRNVTTNGSRSARTLVGIGQINPPVSSGATEQHASSSEPQWRSTLPTISKQQRRQPTSTTSRPAIAAPSADVHHKSPGHRSAASRLRHLVEVGWWRCCLENVGSVALHWGSHDGTCCSVEPDGAGGLIWPIPTKVFADLFLLVDTLWLAERAARTRELHCWRCAC
jgi:hypothetical protein